MVVASRRRIASLFSINRFRVLEHGLDNAPGTVFEPLKKTAAAPRMTGNPSRLFHDQKDGIVVAIEPDFADMLNVARLLALFPELPPRARPVMREPRLRSARKRLAIHPCQRQDL